MYCLGTPDTYAQIGKKRMSSKKSMKKRSSNVPLKTTAIVKMGASSCRLTGRVDVMMIVAEITRCNKEVVEAKDKVISMLESSLQAHSSVVSSE